MTYIEHLTELRKRLLIVLVVFLGFSILCFGWSKQLATFLVSPVQPVEFVFLSPPDLFMTYLSLSLYAGFVLSLPVILYEIGMFIWPGLEKKERKAIFLSLLLGALLFIAGVAFGFFIMLPYMLKFFLGFGTEGIKPMISIRDYLNFVGQIVLSFGIAFELPVVTTALAGLGVINAAQLKSARKIAVLVIFIVAAILTPPDVVSQLLLALPLLVLFEVSIVLASFVEKKSKAKVQEAT
ncbi:MAG: twin-arginine translocase subunit TatC [Rectinema sp.]|jgi:sec-independent protein translocase protein TatC|uniref:Sec-independent protein translocase protein TatC n=1 Tax=uncultured spirochete TaxID=156406 RepID=A0A3P3XT60_9SPIR|nr:Sec-independent protein translocase protein TatC [uncultured spirochete]